MSEEIKEEEVQKIEGSHEIAALLVEILQPAMAGGLPEARAEEIFHEILGSMYNLEGVIDGKTAFQLLLENITEKWYPMAKSKTLK